MLCAECSEGSWQAPLEQVLLLELLTSLLKHPFLKISLSCCLFSGSYPDFITGGEEAEIQGKERVPIPGTDLSLELCLIHTVVSTVADSHLSPAAT